MDFSAVWATIKTYFFLPVRAGGHACMQVCPVFYFRMGGNPSAN